MSNSVPLNGYVDPNFPSPNGPDDAKIIIYGYLPDLAFCILALILFSLALALHSFRLIRHRTYYFVPMTVACLFEILGYIFRTLSRVHDPYRITYYILEYFFITVAPVFISASIYVCLSKLLHWSGPQKRNFDEAPGLKPRFLNPKAVLWTFITADILTTIIQITGAALVGKATSNQEDPTKFNDVLLAGLAIQMAFNLIFIIALSYFIIHVQRTPQLKTLFWPRIRVFSISLLVATLMVFARTVFRVAESAQGVLGYLETHEVFFGVFEFSPIVTAVFLLAVWHPGPQSERVNFDALLETGRSEAAEVSI